MITKAMVMSAGLGSRLEPLTLTTPKPLITVANVPVMDILLNNLKQAGIDEVIANTYYLASQIEERYTTQHTVDINFHYVREDELSGTAGGLKKCQHFFDDGENFIVTSADGLFDIDLSKVIEAHEKSGAIATLVAKDVSLDEVSKFGVIVCDENNFVKEFQEKPSQQEAKSSLINTGIYIFNYKIFDYIPQGQFFDFAKNVFPALMEDNQKINVYKTNEYWCDIGSIDQYKLTHKDIFNNIVKIPNIKVKDLINSKLIIGGNTNLAINSNLLGNNVIGSNCNIEDNVMIENSIIYDNVRIVKNSVIRNSIIAENSVIAGIFDEQVVAANMVEEHVLEGIQ